jgi:hypothetical protein
VGLSGSSTIGSLGLSQGTHTLTAVATDAAQNVSVSAPVVVNVDTLAPVARSLGGGGISSAATRTFSWLPAEGGSPIVSARAKICTGVGNVVDCTWIPTTADGPVTFPIEDGYSGTALVEMTDAAGNVGTSGTIKFARDSTGPRAAALSLLSSSDGIRAVQVKSSDPDVVAWQSRLCTTAGCTQRPQQSGGASGVLQVTLPAPGSYSLQVNLVDGAGNIGETASIALPWTGVPGTTPPGPKAIALKSKLPKKLGKTSILVKGTVPTGTTSRISITLTGRRTTGKAFSLTKRTKPTAKGTYSLRVKLPKKTNRRKGVLVTIVADPNTGWLKAIVRKRIRS